MITKILLVEDNDLNRDMLSRRLVNKGFEVETAIDGEDAVKKSEELVPDIILMDLSLPGLDGWEASQKIKAIPKLNHIPIIALTAHAMPGDKEKALLAGCNDYDTKPIDLPRLLGKMEVLLKK